MARFSKQDNLLGQSNSFLVELTYHQLRGYLKKHNLLDGSIDNELS